MSSIIVQNTLKSKFCAVVYLITMQISSTSHSLTKQTENVKICIRYNSMEDI